MNRYIDAEKLKAEIERRKEKWLAASRLIKKGKDKAMYAAGKSSGYTEIFSLINSLQQEQPEEICSKCIHHGKDDDYCYYPHGGMQSLINENGVYECTGFCEQEQPEVDLEKELNQWRHGHFNGKRDGDYSGEYLERKSQLDIARHFYELGLSARKKK